MALLLETDPVALVRVRGPSGEGAQLEQYVNDRRYAADSFLGVAMARLFTTAMSGRSKDRPELADTAIPLSTHLHVIAACGGEDLVRWLFEPLGYAVEVKSSRLDESFPEWGASSFVSLTISGSTQLQDMLTHRYVLFRCSTTKSTTGSRPTRLKSSSGVERGGLAPIRKRTWSYRYLKHQRSLTREVLDRLLVDEPERKSCPLLKKQPSLHEARLQTVFETLKETGAKRVLNLGCRS